MAIGLVAYSWLLFSGIVLGGGFKYAPVHEITTFNKVFRAIAVPGAVTIVIFGLLFVAKGAIKYFR